MQIHKMIIVAAAMLVAGQAAALDPKGYQVIHTSQLVEICSLDEADPLYNEAMGYCLGYVDAALHYHAALTVGSRSDPIACPPSTITREEVVIVLLDWAKDNAQQIHSETPVHGVMRAVAEKWPCSER
ncbi:MAG: Rap1a/Tai family immunity protein [Chromatiaceae bacterium]|jgi:hypothetical protein